MATKNMLIDASHPEETRVVVIEDTRLEDYDVEVASRRQLKGNIYLAKVTRVEPSLQAAFVDYGGNRHGFLAFSEIHPDYYQIPIADRQALLAEHEVEDIDDEPTGLAGANGDADPVDHLDDDDEEVARRRPRPSLRRYKIQEVIKRRQILLVQVVKEERGNKGAALTTYLSLAGRYGVLMPNTVRGGGISRKITAGTDRSRLKKILADLEIPEGMAVIVRTAGAGRSKAEIKRDYEYLLRLWSSIRDETLESMAPALVYEEANLIKRSIRDLYGRDIEEIIIQGENEYKIAKEFMKLFIPSHAKRVKAYADLETPLFRRYRVEGQLEEMHQPLVYLKSGGSIVLNPTEALVAIDVNSGRATRERHIEETALRTNLEAADEIARQLRLRDLAGLVVVDFIDMEVARNRTQVERRLRDAMKADRARIQLGHISQFGLMELSRQRLRPSLLETSFEICSHCSGTGVRPTTETTVLSILRKLEEEGLAHRSSRLTVTLPTAVAMYLVNEKRKTLSALETQYGLVIALACDDFLIATDFRLDRVQIVAPPPDGDHAEDTAAVPESAGNDETDGEEAADPDPEDSGKRGRRRKPRRRKKATDGETALQGDEDESDADADTDTEETAVDAGEDEADDPEKEGDDDEQAADGARKKRRRGKRGGRRRSRKSGQAEEHEQDNRVVIPIEDGAASSSPGAAADDAMEAAADGGPAAFASRPDRERHPGPDGDTDEFGTATDTDMESEAGDGGGQRTTPADEGSEDGEGSLSEHAEQSDLLETADVEADGPDAQADGQDGTADDVPDDRNWGSDGEHEVAAPVTPPADGDAETPPETPPFADRERELDFAGINEAADNAVAPSPDHDAMPDDRAERADGRDENDGERDEDTSRNNVIDVDGGGGRGDEDFSPQGMVAAPIGLDERTVRSDRPDLIARSCSKILVSRASKSDRVIALERIGLYRGADGTMSLAQARLLQNHSCGRSRIHCSNIRCTSVIIWIACSLSDASAGFGWIGS